MKFIEIAGTTFAVDAIESVSFQPKAERDGSRPNRIKELTYGTLIVGLKRGETVNLSAFQDDYTQAVALLVDS